MGYERRRGTPGRSKQTEPIGQGETRFCRFLEEMNMSDMFGAHWGVELGSLIMMMTQLTLVGTGQA
jgi:hypothetical protein